MKTLSVALCLAAALGVKGRAVSRCGMSKCPEFTKGSFSIEQYQLYPTGTRKNCLVYFGRVSIDPKRTF